MVFKFVSLKFEKKEKLNKVGEAGRESVREGRKESRGGGGRRRERERERERKSSCCKVWEKQTIERTNKQTNALLFSRPPLGTHV
jgi:hypothetical protein